MHDSSGCRIDTVAGRSHLHGLVAPCSSEYVGTVVEHDLAPIHRCDLLLRLLSHLLILLLSSHLAHQSLLRDLLMALILTDIRLLHRLLQSLLRIHTRCLLVTISTLYHLVLAVAIRLRRHLLLGLQFDLLRLL